MCLTAGIGTDDVGLRFSGRFQPGMAQIAEDMQHVGGETVACWVFDGPNETRSRVAISTDQ
jgi:hypothetical protein